MFVMPLICLEVFSVMLRDILSSRNRPAGSSAVTVIRADRRTKISKVDSVILSVMSLEKAVDLTHIYV